MWVRPGVLSRPVTLAFALLFAAATVSCRRPSATVLRSSAAPKLSEPAPLSRSADDAGRFLSGLPAGNGSSFKYLETQEAWDVHRRELDQLWKRVQEKWIPAMRAFQKEELSGAPFEDSLLFYPFSGPDVLMATVFFPRSPVCVMVGLEPAGTLPTPRQFAREDLSGYLAEVRDSVSSELERSFFITREMDREFRGQVTDGLLPPILLLLARTGHTVLGHRYVRLDADGRVVERPADYRAPGKIGNKGIQIDFRGEEDHRAHTLYYFSVNLSDDWLRQNKPFLMFLERLKGVVTFFKATSYMPHEPSFSIIRERILASSNAILQDDSGIPYRFFDPARWQVQLYGSYDRPYGSFRWLEQPDLRRAYETSTSRPLGFHIGYGFSRIPSNLQLVKRKM
ncbi:MAG: hypothetical protein ACE141_13450 [Bryobacteraceae bacterium]